MCPFCGVRLSPPLNDGIMACGNCDRLFDNGRLHTLLSAAWLCRKNHIPDAEVIREQFRLTSDDVQIIQQHVIDGSLNNHEFQRLAQQLLTT